MPSIRRLSGLKGDVLMSSQNSLAYCELYLTIWGLFAAGGFSFELFETGRSDVECAHDYFNPGFPEESKGVRVLVN